MPRKYNVVAAQIRIIRAQLEEWPRRGCGPSVVDSDVSDGLYDTYENHYKRAQWKAHKQHLWHVQLSGKQERNSGDALYAAKPSLTTKQYDAARRDKRVADSLRHPEQQVRRPKFRWNPEAALFYPGHFAPLWIPRT